MSSLGYHFPVEALYTDNDFDRIIKHLQIVAPEWCNVTAGGKPDRAMILTQRIVNETSTRVIYRQRQSIDDGIWTRMTPEQWYNVWAKPLLLWIKNTCKGRVVLMTDNESVQADMRPYGKWMAQAMRLGGLDGLSLAVGAFSVGTPDDGSQGVNQYAQLDDMWQGLHYWNGSGGVPMIFRPHEYFSKTPQESGGRINRYRLAWDRCKLLGITSPPTVIGEFGLAITSAKGWRSQQGYLGNQYAQDGQRYFGDWYEKQGVSALWYSWEDWPIVQSGKPNEGFGVGLDDSFLREMETWAIKRRALVPSLPVTKPLPPPPVVVTLPPVIVTPPPAPAVYSLPESDKQAILARLEAIKGELLALTTLVNSLQAVEVTVKAA